jgi:hypothetical protein
MNVVSTVLRRFRRPLEIGVFVQVPAISVLWLAWFVYGHGGGGDFAIFRRAGRAVLHGHSPYVHPTVKLLAANDRFVYPTPFALPFIPFTFSPEKAAAVGFLVLSVAAVLASVWLLDVRDWRCYGASLLGLPVFGSLGVGSIGPFLLLLCALGWRFRHRTVAGLPIALAAAAKLFLWPLLIWLLVTRRFRAFAASLATIGAILVVWASIDAGGMRRYPQTIRLLDDVQRWKSAALIATPILWTHYLVLLLAPIALARPRLAPLWLLPILLWATPHPESLGVVWRIALVLAVIGLVAVQVLRPESRLTERLAGLPRLGTGAKLERI